MDYIYAFTHQSHQLTDFIDTFSFSEADFMLLETVTDICFDVYRKTDFHRWSQGRIFNKTREIKWRNIGNEFKTVVITPDDTLTGDTKRETIPFEPEDLDIYLWGKEAASKSTPEFTFEKNQFIEAIIPRILQYPVKAEKKDSRVLLTVTRYVDKYGKLQYYRFKGVKTDE